MPCAEAGNARRAWLAALVLAFGAAGPAHADDACAGYTWDVHRERALFAAAPRPLAAGRDLASAPLVTPDQLFELTLVPEADISYAIAPAKAATAGASGGLARLAIAAAGRYRISLDQGAWIDVAANGALLTARDHQGVKGCAAPRKIVEFDLPAGAQLTLQLSGGSASKALLTMTAAPPGP